MATRHRYLGRSWPGLPERDIEPDEDFDMTEAVSRGAYIPETVEDEPEPEAAPKPAPKPRAPRKTAKAKPKR
jgi:hypothetical protein